MDDVQKPRSAHVTMRPSGREFDVEGHDTLLQAGLSAGLDLNYGCANGTCGLCKVRVISGSVVRVQPHDYALSEAEKLQGFTLLCAHAPGSSEVVLETLEALGPRDIPEQRIVARVRAITPLGRDTMLLHLQTPRTNRLRFLAGQTVILEAAAAAGAKDNVRATYPIAGCPCDDRNLQFYVGRESGDPIALRVFAHGFKAGDAVTICGPQGDFVLAEGRRSLVFAVCDIGFAPARGLIEHALAMDGATPIALHWLAARADGHFLVNQCRAWSDALDNFHYSLYADADVNAGARALVQAMQADSLIAEPDFYVAGPESFISTTRDGLREAGIPERKILTLAV